MLFKKCLKENGGNESACESFKNLLNTCGASAFKKANNTPGYDYNS